MTEVSKAVHYNRTIKAAKAEVMKQANVTGRSAKLVSISGNIAIWVVAERKGKKVVAHFEHLGWVERLPIKFNSKFEEL